MAGFRQQREEMVRTQLRGRGICDARVLEAMRSVPRDRFVPEDWRALSYRDSPLPIGAGQTISQPYIVARMIEALELEPGDRVLEVGAGSGYAGAVLSCVAAEVFGIEYLPEFAERARTRLGELGYANVEIRQGDGTHGWPAHAPFDAILVSAGSTDVPQPLLDQLAIGGRLVIPVGDRARGQQLLCVHRLDECEFESDSLGSVRFVPLVEADHPPRT